MTSTKSTVIVVEIGIMCQHCGSSNMRVYRTKPTESAIDRERICEDCGKLTFTAERNVFC